MAPPAPSALFCLLNRPHFLRSGPTITPAHGCVTLDDGHGFHASDFVSDHLLHLGSTTVSNPPPRSHQARRQPSLVLNQPERGVCGHAAPSKPECRRQTSTHARPQCALLSPRGCVRHFAKRSPSTACPSLSSGVSLQPAELANRAGPAGSAAAGPRPPTAGRPLLVPKVCFTDLEGALTGKLRLLVT